MKTRLLLPLLLIHFFSYSQKNLKEFEKAYNKGEYAKCKILIGKISPTASKEIKDNKKCIDFYNKAGKIYFDENNLDTAEIFFAAAAGKAKTTYAENDFAYALPIYNLAMVYKEQGRYSEAEPLFLKSLPVFAATFGPNSLDYTKCFYVLGQLYTDMKKYTEAESICAAAVNYFKEIPGQQSDEYLGALTCIGIIYTGQGKYPEAEEIYVALLNYFNSLQPQPDETLSVLYNNLGELYRHMGRYEEAESQLSRSLEKNSGNNSLSNASTLNNLGLVYKAMDKYPEAEAAYKKSISIYRELNMSNHPDYTNPVNNLGELFRKMSRYPEAAEAFNEVISIRKKLLGDEHPNYANAINNLALIESEEGLYSQAIEHLTQCEFIYKKTLGESDKLYLNCLNNLADVYLKNKEFEKSEQLYKKCLAIYKENYGEQNDKYAYYQGGLGALYYQTGRYKEAADVTRNALLTLGKMLGENHSDYLDTELGLAAMSFKADDYQNSKKYYLHASKGYLELIKKIFPYLNEREKTQFYFNLGYKLEDFNLFVSQWIEKFPGSNNDTLLGRLYDNQLMIKSLLLKEAEKTKTLALETENSELKAKYETLLKMREEIIGYYHKSTDELSALGINLANLEKEANELEQQINISLHTSSSLTQQNEITWKDVQKKLNPSEYAVEMIRIASDSTTINYLALVIDNKCKAPRYTTIKNGYGLETDFYDRYKQLLYSQDDLSYSLYWAPVFKAVNKAVRIYFSSDGVYHKINVNTLMNPVTKKYVLEETDIVFVTNTGSILNAASVVNNDTADIFSYPDYDLLPTQNSTTNSIALVRDAFTSFQELPGTKEEATTIKNILEKNHWVVNEYMQKEASEENIKKIKSPGILHIATHGYFLKNISFDKEKTAGMNTYKIYQNPLLRSGLVLAGAAAIAKDSAFKTEIRDDGILTAYEVMNMNLSHTGMVVLSACETGLGSNLINGQGVYGLQRSFMIAGAQSVVMSLWNVADEATKDLMSIFYSEWIKNPTAENRHKALRTAQLKLKQQYKTPIYWGAFVMVEK